MLRISLTAAFSVPRQDTGWTCGYECMILSHLMRKHLMKNGPITTKNIGTVNKALDHDSGDAYVLRLDLAAIAAALRASTASSATPRKAIQTSVPTTLRLPDTPSFTSEDEDHPSSDAENDTKVLFERTNKRSRSRSPLLETKYGSLHPERYGAASRRKKLGEGCARGLSATKRSVGERSFDNREKAKTRQLEEHKAKVTRLSGMLSQSPAQEEPLDEAAKSSKRRLKEQSASSTAQIKDDTMRSGVAQLQDLNRRCNILGSYGDDKLDEMWPTTKFVTLIRDEVSARPGRSAINPCRGQPLRLCLGLTDPDEIFDFFQDMLEHLNEMITVTNRNQLERELFGQRGRRVSRAKIHNLQNTLAKTQSFVQCTRPTKRSSPKPEESKKTVGKVLKKSMFDDSSVSGEEEEED